MKINPSNLIGPQLDYAVARAEGKRPSMFIYQQTGNLAKEHQYSSNWSQGGPIIEREKINTKSNLTRMPNHPDYDWQADCPEKGQCVSYHGPTPLIAAMRCYVASKLGNIIDIPEELS